MTSKTLLLRPLRPTNLLRSTHSTTRTFITLPSTEPQSLTATRILPYKASSIYSLISDVDSYSTFLPYCQYSKVTKWSSTDNNGKRWPLEADLTVGWGGYEETFTSKLFCVPGSIVEALGGEAVTKLQKSDLAHHLHNSSTFETPPAATENSIFQSLRTRWTVKPVNSTSQAGQLLSTTTTGQPGANAQTEVHLSLEFQFANPVYAALSRAVAPKVAGIMIEAFEGKARSLLQGRDAGVEEKHPVMGRHI